MPIREAKKIDMQTMGQQFKEAREKRGLTLSQIAAQTHIKMQHLEMMERDDFSKMPAPMYARGFIRMYASFLGLDSAPLIEEYAARQQIPVEEPSPKPVAPSRTERRVATREEAPPKPPKPAAPPRQKFDWRGWKKAWGSAVHVLPKLLAILAIVLVVFGVSRCVARLRFAEADKKTTPALLNAQAIMKEPAVHYLDLPVAEEPAR
jgi:transcriptional regulator with XRE-family HTH domain